MLYLQNVRSFTSVEAGVWTLPPSLESFVASRLGAALSHRFGPRLAMPLGMGLQAGACLLVPTWSADFSYATMCLPSLALKGVACPARCRWRLAQPSTPNCACVSPR